MKITFSENQKNSCIESLKLSNRLGHHDFDYVADKIKDFKGLEGEDLTLLTKIFNSSKDAFNTIDIQMSSRYATMKLIEKKLTESNTEVELSDTEVDILWKANETLFRLNLNQFWSLSEELEFYQFGDYLYPKFESEVDTSAIRYAQTYFKEQMDSLSKEIRKKENSNEDVFIYAFDNWQTLRNHMAWKRQPEGGLGVAYDNVMKKGDDELPKITDHEAPPRQKRNFRRM